MKEITIVGALVPIRDGGVLRTHLFVIETIMFTIAGERLESNAHGVSAVYTAAGGAVGMCGLAGYEKGSPERGRQNVTGNTDLAALRSQELRHNVHCSRPSISRPRSRPTCTSKNKHPTTNLFVRNHRGLVLFAQLQVHQAQPFRPGQPRDPSSRLASPTRIPTA